MSSELFAAIAGAFVGAVITAWLTYLFSSSTKRRDLSLHFIREFQKSQRDQAEVLHLMAHPELCLEGSDANANFNKVLSFGDQLDLFALCYRRNALDRGLAIEAGIRKIADKFSVEIGKSFPELKPSEDHWRSLRDLASMHHHR